MCCLFLPEVREFLPEVRAFIRDIKPRTNTTPRAKGAHPRTTVRNKHLLLLLLLHLRRDSCRHLDLDLLARLDAGRAPNGEHLAVDA